MIYTLEFQHRLVPNCCIPHWGWATHICVVDLTITGSDNGLSPIRRQAIIWTNAGILLIGPLGTNFSEILIKIYKFSVKKMHLKMSSGKWRPSCLGLNVIHKWCLIQSMEVVLCLTVAANLGAKFALLTHWFLSKITRTRFAASIFKNKFSNEKFQISNKIILKYVTGITIQNWDKRTRISVNQIITNAEKDA